MFCDGDFRMAKHKFALPLRVTSVQAEGPKRPRGANQKGVTLDYQGVQV
jgi:hypothetical protein